MIAALSQAGWTIDNSQGGIGDIRRDCKKSADGFWNNWGRKMFGGDVGCAAGRMMRQFDGTHADMATLYSAGIANERVMQFFAPLKKFGVVTSRYPRRGNLERFDYWLNMIRATSLRLKTWLVAQRLADSVRDASKITDAVARRAFTRKQILPLRIGVARGYGQMIATLVDCAKSPGEVGVISHFEFLIHDQLVSSQDALIQQLLGETLPPETAVRTKYCGRPRIFVPARCTQMNPSEPHEIRAFVLSAAECNEVALFWRQLGSGTFQKVIAMHGGGMRIKLQFPLK